MPHLTVERPFLLKKFVSLLLLGQFVERRRAALERFLARTASHPSLRTDPDLRDFLENESELPKSNQTSALSGKNVMKFITKGVDKMTNMTVRMEETDEW